MRGRSSGFWRSAVVAWCVMVAVPALARDRAGQVLADVRAAAGGGWAQAQALSWQGEIDTAGLSGSIVGVEDLIDGRYVNEFALGAIKGAQGYDGDSSWSLAPGGETVRNDSTGAREEAANQAWFTRRGFLRTDIGGARVRYGERVQEGERAFDVLEATPPGGRAQRLWFDVRTHRLDRVVDTAGAVTTTLRLDDYREVAGMFLPHRSVSDQGDPKYRTEVRIAHVHVVPRPDPERFAMPATSRDDVHFAGAARSVTVPFELINNHIYVSALLDEQPVRMLVDTGGVNLVTRAAAQRLGLTVSGSIEGRGGGKKTVDVGVTQAKSLRIGDLTLTEPNLFVFDMSELQRVEGVDFDGLIGFEAFKRFVVRIDYAAQRLSLTDPAHAPAPQGTAVPFRFDERTPIVEGSIAGIPARFTIDTGARNSLTLNSPFVREHDLAQRFNAGAERVTGWGVGGAVRSQPVRADQLMLGDVRVDGIVAELFRGTQGAFADDRHSGNIGAGVLRRFTVTFDYGKQMMWLAPNASADMPDHFDRAGMWFNEGDTGFVVVDVAADGPAAVAGVRVGDVITALAGLTTTEWSLGAARTHLRDTAHGSKIAVRVRRGQCELDLTLTLRDLL